jgi:hypothetical protein
MHGERERERERERARESERARERIRKDSSRLEEREIYVGEVGEYFIFGSIKSILFVRRFPGSARSSF